MVTAPARELSPTVLRIAERSVSALELTSSRAFTRYEPLALTVTTRPSSAGRCTGSVLACGSRIRIRPSAVKFDDSMKNTTSSSTTSISDTTLISGSSLRRGLNFMADLRSVDASASAQRDARLGAVACRGLHRVRQTQRMFFHLHHYALDPAAQVPVGHQRRNRHAQAGRSRH